MSKKITILSSIILLLNLGVAEPIGSAIEEQEQQRLSTDLSLSAKARYNLLLGELALLRQDYVAAREHYDELLSYEQNIQFLQRRINIELAEENIADARPYLEILVEKDSENIFIWEQLARSQVATEDLEAALDSYHRLIQLSEEGGVNGYHLLIRGLRDNNGNEQLMEILDRLAQLNPQQTEPLIYYALVAIEEGMAEIGEAYLLEALELEPDNEKVYRMLAENYRNQGEIDRAIALLEEGYLVKEIENLAYLYLLLLKQDLQFAAAETLLNKLISEDPENLLHQAEKIIIDYQLGRYDRVTDGIAQFDQEDYLYPLIVSELLEISENNGTAQELAKILSDQNYEAYRDQYFVLQARVALETGDYKHFLGIFDELRSQNFYAQEYYYLVQLEMLESAELYDHYEALLLLAEPVFTNKTIVTFLKGMGHYHQKNFSAMETLFLDYLKEHPEDDIILNAYGYSLLEYDPSRAEEALTYMLKADELNPNQDFIEDSIGWAYYHLDKLDEAEYYLTRAFNKSKVPEMIAHYLHLQNRLENFEVIDELYPKFKQLFPENRFLHELQKRYEWAD